MKKLLLSLSLLLTGASQAQNILAENFDVFPSATWSSTNQSQPVGILSWGQGGGTQFATSYNGGPTSFARVDYLSVAPGASGTISNWLISPAINLVNGDVITFWTRQGGTPPQLYADRMQMRVSMGANVAYPNGAEDIGSFTTLGVDVNPTLAPAGYPIEWTQFSYTITGVPTLTTGRIAFRYYVTSGGEFGDNSNIIGLDAVSVDRNLNTASFFAAHYAVYPNPVANVLNVNAISGSNLNQIQMTDVNGRVVKTQNFEQISEAQINTADLSAGVYVLKITSDAGVGTAKIIKK